MDFPFVDLMDQEGCRQKLFDLLHPEGFACPRRAATEGLNIHRRRPDSPVADQHGYKPLGRTARGHATVNHNRGEFARDDDGDGIREVHCNTLEGIWTGLRNFLRPFRGANKMYLDQHIIIFEWSCNLKAVTDEFLRILLGAKLTTELVT
jgi:hypothetical protein